jgi:hypothetical protein
MNEPTSNDKKKPSGDAPVVENEAARVQPEIGLQHLLDFEFAEVLAVERLNKTALACS